MCARHQARTQEMKEKDHTYVGNADLNSHVCKVCFESLTSAMLLPCRHFCCKSTFSLCAQIILSPLDRICLMSTWFAVCKSCSLACAECPICRTEIADRIFVFTWDAISSAWTLVKGWWLFHHEFPFYFTNMHKFWSQLAIRCLLFSLSL